MNIEHRRRTSEIIEGAEKALAQRPASAMHNFMLSPEEAVEVGHAVARRDQKRIHDFLDSPIEQMEQDYDESTIDELQDEWTEEIASITRVESSLSQFLLDPAHQRVLESVLAGRDGRYLSLRPISKTKLLETIIYVTCPEYTRSFEPRNRSPKKQLSNRSRLYERANLMLTTAADQEVGLRKLRQNLVDGNESTLDEYLESMSRERLAKKVFAEIAENYHQGKADIIRQDLIAKLDSENQLDELALTHILDWELLPPEQTSRSDRNNQLKSLILGRAKSQKHKQCIEENWCPERIDALFEVARLATEQGRNAAVYISGSFDGGLGLYVATAIDHPSEHNKLIVIADNPVHGNALYMVDEATTGDTEYGYKYTWQKVLGAHKKLARKRGAQRRYHRGNWSELPRAVCGIGGEFVATKDTRRSDAHQDEKTQQAEIWQRSYDELIKTLARTAAGIREDS